MATTYDIDQFVDEWRINGFVVFEDFIPEEKIDIIRDAWMPIRDAAVAEQGENSPAGAKRYNVRVPFERPFVDPDIFEHPALVEFIERALCSDYLWSEFDANIPMPGCTEYQVWHHDAYLPFPGVMTPAFTIGAKFPLVDTSEENGSIEIIPATQYVADKDLIRWPGADSMDRLFGKGSERRGRYKSIRLNLKKGSLWVHDSRVIHRGTPNLSTDPRDELCMAICRPWFFSNWHHEHTEPHFPRDLWDSLSDHARQVLRRQRVK